MCQSLRDPERTFKCIHKGSTITASIYHLDKAPPEVKEQMWDTWMRWLHEAQAMTRAEIEAIDA